MKAIRLVVVAVGALMTVLFGGCAKAPPAPESSTPIQSNRNAGQTNSSATDLAATPLYAKTIRGDVERAGLAIMMAQDSVKQQRWDEAVTQLREAKTQVESALTKKPRVNEEFEALRDALIRTTKATENREDVQQQFRDLQARIGALKTFTSQ